MKPVVIVIHHDGDETPGINDYRDGLALAIKHFVDVEVITYSDTYDVYDRRRKFVTFLQRNIVSTIVLESSRDDVYTRENIVLLRKLFSTATPIIILGSYTGEQSTVNVITVPYRYASSKVFGALLPACRAAQEALAAKSFDPNRRQLEQLRPQYTRVAPHRRMWNADMRRLRSMSVDDSLRLEDVLLETQGKTRCGSGVLVNRASKGPHIAGYGAHIPTNAELFIDTYGLHAQVPRFISERLQEATCIAREAGFEPPPEWTRPVFWGMCFQNIATWSLPILQLFHGFEPYEHLQPIVERHNQRKQYLLVDYQAHPFPWHSTSSSLR